MHTQCNEKDILYKIILLLVNLIFNQTMRLPYYFGGTDMMFHTSIINGIINFHHIISPTMNGYQYYKYFPLYHIFIAIGQILINMSLRSNFFIVTGLSFLSSVYFIYLLSYRITLNKRSSLLITLMYSISYETIFAGTSVVPQIMSDILFYVLLFLLISKKSKDIRYNILSIGLILTFVYLHQVSLVQETIIILALIIIEWLIYLENRTISYYFPILFVVCFLGYWIYTAGPFFDNIITTIKSTTNAVNVPVMSQYIAIYKIYLYNLDSSILVFFILIGIIALLIKGYKNRNNVLMVQCAIISFLALPFILPGPATYLTSLLLSYRFPFLLSIFLKTAAGVGIITILCLKVNNKILRIAQHSIVIIVIFIYILVSTLKIADSTDLYLSNLFPPTDRIYFLNSEIAGLDFCIDKLNENIFTDYCSYRYLSANNYQNVFPNIMSYNALDSAKDNYFLFRQESLNERGQIEFITGIQGFMGVSVEYTKDDLDKINLYNNLSNNNFIYSNGTTDLFDIIKSRLY